jgi:putative DNA primase/helicase
MIRSEDDAFKDYLAKYIEACDNPPGDSSKKKAGKGPPAPEAKPPKIILGRHVRERSSVGTLDIPSEGLIDLESLYVDSLVVEQLCDVPQYAVQWLWPGRLPLGRLSLLAGDPGIGKSLVALDIAARVSSGAPWPDTPDVPREPANVLVFSMEDDLSDTIKPRLLRAGADSQRTFVVEGVYNEPPIHNLQWKRRFRIREDIRSVKEMCNAFQPVRLIVFDPIAAYCGNGDGVAMSVVHSMLAPLLETAAQFGIAVLCTTHLTRGSSGKAVYRAANRLSFTTAARAVWSIVRDAVVPEKRLLVPVKLNLAPDAAGLAFRIDGDGKVAWEPEPVRMSADRAMEAEDATSKMSRTVEWLREALKAGPQDSALIIQNGVARGVSERTIRRAADRLSVQIDRKGYGGDIESTWSLPQGAQGG